MPEPKELELSKQKATWNKNYKGVDYYQIRILSSGFL